MVIKTSDSLLAISLTSFELWYLVQQFGPGWVYGIDDPTESLSKDEKVQLSVKARKSLSQKGFILVGDGNQIQIDEMLGGMIYSLLNSKDILMVRNPMNNMEQIFHFLSEWQMEICKNGDGYRLTVFRKREALFQYILSSNSIKMDGFIGKKKFSMRKRDLEMAGFLFASDKFLSANEMLNNGFGDLPDADQFLSGYLKPDFHLIFDMLYHRRDGKRVHSTRRELIEVNGALYWISHDEAGEEAVEMMNFIPITPSDPEELFFDILPKESSN